MKRKRTNLKRYIRDRWMNYIERSYKRDMHKYILLTRTSDINFLLFKAVSKVVERNDDDHFNKKINYTNKKA